MICMGVILYKGIKRIVYGANLKDSSKYIVKELEADAKKLAKLAKKKIEVVNLMREEAVDVLKNWVDPFRNKK